MHEMPHSSSIHDNLTADFDNLIYEQFEVPLLPLLRDPGASIWYCRNPAHFIELKRMVFQTGARLRTA
jgi:hypothetical protein